MDAVTFLQEEIRMCANFQDCTECPLCDTAYCSVSPKKRTQEEAEEIVRRVKDWSAANPRKTRQDVFLEQWPEAMIDKEDIPSVCPQYLDRNLKCERDGNSYKYGCGDCRRKFWRKGIE